MFVFLNLVSPATVFLEALGPLARYRPYCCLTAVLAICSSSDIISALHLGDFAVPSDLPRFSSPESPLPAHSASCSYRFCHGLLSSSWPCSRIFTTATHSDIYLLMCWLSGSFYRNQAHEKEVRPVLTICLTQWFPASISQQGFSKWLNFSSCKAESSGPHQNHWPMLIGFRNEYRTDGVPDLEMGNIPRGIDCVQCKAAPKGKMR